MKKVLLAISVFVLSLSAFAFDWGGRFDSDTSFVGIANNDLKLRETDTLGLWLSAPISKDNTKYFAAEGLYQFKYDLTDKASDELTNTLDVSLCKFVINHRINGLNSISINAGRFGVSDATGLIFSQVADGACFVYNGPIIRTSLFAGYTGLLNANTVTILNSSTTSYSIGENAVYRLAPKYVPFGVVVSFPSLFANQTLTAQGWGFIDCNGDDYNRFYGSLGLEGYITRKTFYSLKSTFGSENFESISNLSTLDVNVYFTNTFYLKAGGTYASGENGSMSAFKGFTSMTALLSADEPQYSSLLMGDLGLGKVFGKNISANALAALAFNVDDEVSYKGVQLQANALFRILNDIQFGLKFSQFLADNSNENKTQLSIKAVVVF